MIRSPEEQVLPDRMQKGRDQNLAQLLRFPTCQTPSTPRASLVQGALLCASGLPFSSQSMVPYFLNSFTPQYTSAAPALRRSQRNLPDLQHPCLSTSLHTRVSHRAPNGECRTRALSNEQLEASMMRDQERSRMEQELRATTSRQRQRGKAVAAAWTRVGFWGSVINESVKSELFSSEPRDRVHRCPTVPWGSSLSP